MAKSLPIHISWGVPLFISIGFVSLIAVILAFGQNQDYRSKASGQFNYPTPTPLVRLSVTPTRAPGCSASDPNACGGHPDWCHCLNTPECTVVGCVNPSISPTPPSANCAVYNPDGSCQQTRADYMIERNKDVLCNPWTPACQKPAIELTGEDLKAYNETLPLCNALNKFMGLACK